MISVWYNFTTHPVGDSGSCIASVSAFWAARSPAEGGDGKDPPPKAGVVPRDQAPPRSWFSRGRLVELIQLPADDCRD